MALRLEPERLVVYASTWKRGREGAEATAAFDAEQPFTVVRDTTTMLLPTPAATRTAVGLLREHGCTAVWFGAAAPLGLMAPALRKAGAERLVATTHGHEAGWAQLPASRQLLHRIGESTDTITYLGEYTRSRIAAALSPEAAARMVQLPPGVDEKVFHPGSGGTEVRARLGLTDRPVVVCVSRLVPRKGQDTLILAMPRILARQPDAVLLVVGGGRTRRICTGSRGRPGSPNPCGSRGRCPGPNCPRITGPATSSPCRAGRGVGAWTSKGSASSTWRRPPRGCLSSPGTPGVRPTRSSTGRPAGSSGVAPGGGRGPHPRAARRPGTPSEHG